MTGDESWFYHKQIGRKSSNAARTSIRGTPPSVARHNRFAPRTVFCIFFKTTGPALIHHVDRGDTIDYRYYIDNCSESLVEEIRKQRLTSGIYAIKLHHHNAGAHIL